ncbi:hypothetical protein SH611_16045 [Geminicoccaceae bacterium 1502E]|nr:hypothetical protein [Geminicoccaceae bacterium 1502E]
MERSFVRSWELRAYRIRPAATIASGYRGREAALKALQDEMVFNLGHCQGELAALRSERKGLRPVWKDTSVGVGGACLSAAGLLGLFGGPVTGALAIAGAAATAAGFPLAVVGGKWSLDGIRQRRSLHLRAEDLEREVRQLEAAIARVKEAEALSRAFAPGP